MVTKHIDFLNQWAAQPSHLSDFAHGEAYYVYIFFIVWPDVSIRCAICM